MRLFLLSFFFAFAGSCATHRVQNTTAGAAGVQSEAEVLLAAANEAWLQRDDRASLENAIAAYTKALAANPGDVFLLTRLTRATYFLADAFLTEDEKMEGFLTSVRWGDQALMTQADIAAEIEGGAFITKALPLVQQNLAEALYWRSSALGKWAAANGFGTIVKYKNEIFGSMTRVTELGPTMLNYGPDRYWGVYYAKAPAFAGGDLDTSKQSFEKAIAGAPNYWGTYVLYARYYATKSQDKALYQELLEKVVAGDPTLIEGLEPEMRQEQKKAKHLLEIMDEFFID